MTPKQTAARALTVGAAGGIIGFVVLLIFVLATGQTFGQRCATLHKRDTEQWQQCVADLAAGGSDAR